MNAHEPRTLFVEESFWFTQWGLPVDIPEDLVQEEYLEEKSMSGKVYIQYVSRMVFTSDFMDCLPMDEDISDL